MKSLRPWTRLAFQKTSWRIVSKGHRRSGPICDSLPDRYEHCQLHVDGEIAGGQGEAEEPARQRSGLRFDGYRRRTAVWLGQKPAFSNSHRVRRIPEPTARASLGTG